MKPLRGKDASRSCSCTSCLYKSESESPSIKNVIMEGSRIDKLYLGKYIPLREQKLLNKLIRTRGVYDDIRKQLLSDTNLPGAIKSKNLPDPNTSEEYYDTDKSNAITEIVSLVDKGAVGQSSLSECCSCCSCGSKLRLEGAKERAHQRRVSKILIRKARQKQPQALLDIKTSGFSQEYETRKDRKFKTAYHKIRSNMGQAVKNSATKVKESRKKIETQVKQSLENVRYTKNKIKDSVSESFNNIVQNFKNQLGSKELDANELIELYENTFDEDLRIKDSILKYKEDMQKKKILEKWACDFECDSEICEPEQCYLKKKLSLLKKRRQIRDTYVSDIESEDTNKPESLSEFDNHIQSENQKLQTITKAENKQEPPHNLDKTKTSIVNREQSGKRKRPDRHEALQIKVKGRSEKTLATVKTKSTKSSSDLPLKSQMPDKPYSQSAEHPFFVNQSEKKTISINYKRPGKRLPFQVIAIPAKSKKTPYLDKRQPTTKKKYLTLNNIPVGNSSVNVDVQNKKSWRYQTTTLPQNRFHFKTSSSGGNAIEDARAGDHDLKRCFCTLKLKSRRVRKKPSTPSVVESTSKRLQTIKSKNISQLVKLLPFECEPMICIPGKCDPIDCDKRIRQRNLKHTFAPNLQNIKHRANSTPSLVTKTVATGEIHKPVSSLSKPVERKKNRKYRQPVQMHVSEDTSKRQAIRIGSKFSFDIEFYKDTFLDNELQDLKHRKLPHKDIMKFEKKAKIKNNKELNKIENRHNMHLVNLPSQLNNLGKSKHTLTKHRLRRCFCTIRLAKEKKVKPTTKTFSQGTVTSGQTLSTVNNKLISTVKPAKKLINNQFEFMLHPFECEPGVCKPDKCDPHECQKVVNTRYIKYDSKSTGTLNHLSKSTYSIINRPVRNFKAKEVQSVLLKPNKHSKQHKLKNPRAPKYSLSNTNKQSVNTGSNFRFDVEFLKEKSPSLDISPRPYEKLQNSNRTDSSHGERKTKQNKPKLRHETEHLIEKPTIEQNKKKNKGLLINAALKSCFCTQRLQKLFKITHRKTVDDTEIKPHKQIYPIVEMSSKITETGKKLNPYECDPYFCIPGNCNPHQCLNRIKSRNKAIRKDFGTTMNKTKLKSTSSVTTSSSLMRKKNVKMQSFYQNETIPRARKKMPTKSLKLDDKTSRQAVNISSTFSFNIEFYKENKNLIHDSTEKQQRKSSLKTFNASKHDNNMLKNTIKRSESKGMHMKRSYRTTGIQPILKRCFCTLKLQNKDTALKNKYPNTRNIEATVMPAQIYYKNITKKRPGSIQARKHGKFCKKDLCKSKLLHTSSMNNIIGINKTVDHKHYQLTTSCNSVRLKRNPFHCSFCAFNLEIHDRNKLKYKREPYTSGICVSGKCDPIECQKQIMRRFMGKKTNSITASSKKSLSIIRGTNYPYAESRSIKSQFQDHVRKRNGAKTNLQGLTNNSIYPVKHNQAVRVGSSFSFNIEFSKDRRAGFNTFKGKKSLSTTTGTRMNERELKTIGTRGNKFRMLNEESQSATIMHNKGTNINRNYNRCFCTLKLQKRGKQQNTINDDAVRDSSVHVLKTIGQNTIKSKRYTQNLERYECEPNVCIPGECDPYDCLNKIKMRNMKELGTEVQPWTVSTSTMTVSAKKATADKYSQHNKKTPKYTKLVKESEFQEISKHENTSEQSVRLGSSLRFDIEFYKNKTMPLDDYCLSKNQKQNRRSRETEFNKIFTKKQDRAQQNNDSKSYKNRNSQATASTKNKITKTSTFLKRCFCTAKLRKPANALKKYNINKPIPNRIVSKQIKVLNKPISNKIIRSKKSPEVEILSNVRDAHIQAKPLKLKPYECEPGICIPGQCDPRECKKLLTKRFYRHLSTSTHKFNSNSSTQSYIHPRKMKDQNVQSSTVKNIPKKKHFQEYNSKNLKAINNDKRIVKIGSNFSFNIEFHKDEKCLSPNRKQVYKNETYRKDFFENKQEIPKKCKSVCVDAVKNLNHKSQIISQRTQSKASGIGPLLKRCFCTLKLQKNAKQQLRDMSPAPIKGKDVSVATKGMKYQDNIFKDTGTKTRKMYPRLEAYECEPGVCIPGKCNPMECYEKIKKRNLRSLGTETKTYDTKSVCSLVRKQKKYIKETQTSINANVERNPLLKNRKKAKHTDDSLSTQNRIKNQNRQCVRIGSSFNFDIEFSKNRSRSYLNNINKIDKTKYNVSTSEKQNRNIKVNTHGTNYNKGTFTSQKEQQAQTEKKDKGSGMIPLIKRCFCTLALQKTENKATNNHTEKVSESIIQQPLKVYTENKSSAANLKYRQHRETPTHILDPHECEPGVCIPGQCNPYDCLERIKRRGIRRQSRTVGTRRICSQSRSVGTAFKLPRSHSKHKNTQSNVPWIVEKPRFPLVNPKTWQGVRVGSNISVKMEFYKKLIYPDDAYSNSNKKTLLSVDDKSANVIDMYNNTNTHNNFNDSVVQANQESLSKASETRKALKRCFCTAKLQNINTKKNHNQVLRVARVDHIQTMSPFKSTQSKNQEFSSKLSNFNSKKYLNKNQEIPNVLTIAEISGDYLTKNMSVLYDPNTGKETTVFLVGGTDIDCKIGKGNKYKEPSKLQKSLVTKDFTSYKCDNVCPYCKSIKGKNVTKKANKTMYGKNAATRVNDKYLKGEHQYTLRTMPKKKRNFESCNFKKCRSIFELFTKKDLTYKNQEDMETILPYAPRKFNKKQSKTYLRYPREYDSNYSCCSKCFCSRECRRTKNKSENIHSAHRLLTGQNNSSINQPTIKRFLCACLPKFIKQKGIDRRDMISVERQDDLTLKNTNNLKKSKSDRCPQTPCFEAKPSKNIRVTQTQANIKDTRFTRKGLKKHVQERSQNVNKNQNVLIERKLLSECNEPYKECFNKKVTFADKSENSVTNENYAALEEQKPTQYSIVKISGNALRKVIHKAKTPQESSVVKVSGTDINCEIDRRDVNSPNISIPRNKLARRSTLRNDDMLKEETQMFEEKQKHKFSLKINKKGPFYTQDRPCYCMRNYEGITLTKQKNELKNKFPDEKIIIENQKQKPLVKSNKKATLIKHDKICCCGTNKEEINISHGRDKFSKTEKNKVAKKLTAKDKHNIKIKPCICGSKVCDKESKKQQAKKYSSIKNKKSTKACVCGSPACKRLAQLASSNRNALNALCYLMKLNKNVCLCGGKHTCECTIYLRKLKEKKRREIMKELAKRRAEYQKEDEIRNRKRFQQEKKLLRRAKRNRKASDIALLTASLCDVAKLGCSAIGDISRSTYRTISDPRNTYETMKSIATHPEEACVMCKNALANSSIGSTFRRIGYRCKSMSCAKHAKKGLTQLADFDPKSITKRKKKKRTIRKREPLDFQCSLYMASLRKRPFLAVYYACPWFYPHFLSLLNVWRQFTDIILFLLAVLVWSPCILTMELCRALMCCTLCTS